MFTFSTDGQFLADAVFGDTSCCQAWLVQMICLLLLIDRNHLLTPLLINWSQTPVSRWLEKFTR